MSKKTHIYVDHLQDLSGQEQFPRRIVQNIRSSRIIQSESEQVVHPVQHVHGLLRQRLPAFFRLVFFDQGR